MCTATWCKHVARLGLGSEGWSDRKQGKQRAKAVVPGVAVVLRTIQGAWVLPRLEDRGQPPFLDELDAGNLGVLWRLREGAHAPPPGPHGLMTRWLSL